MTMKYDADDERVTIPFALYALYVFFFFFFFWFCFVLSLIRTLLQHSAFILFAHVCMAVYAATTILFNVLFGFFVSHPWPFIPTLSASRDGHFITITFVRIQSEPNATQKRKPEGTPRRDGEARAKGAR